MRCEWKKVKISDVCKICYGKDHKQLLDGNVPAYGSGGIIRRVNKSIHEKKSVLIPRKGSLDNLFFVDPPFWTVDTLFWTDIDETKINPAFFFYQLKTLDLASKNVGTAVPSLTTSVLNDIEINLPSMDIQKQIAAILSALDEKIAINRAINENLERQAMAMVSEYAEGTLYSSAFSDIMNFDNGFAFQSSTYLPGGKYKIITIKNVQDGYIDSTGSAFIDSLPQRMKDNCILNIGDVLLSLTGNVGRVGIVCEENLLLNQRVAKIVPIDNKLLPFLYFVFRQSGIKTKLETIAKGTAQLNLSPIETLKLTIPYEESSAIQLSQLLEPLYRKIINNNQESYSFALLRDTLLPKLMSGEIDASAVQL